MKKLIYFLILIIGVCGWWIGNGKLFSEIQSEIEEINITTDKMEYDVGEIVKVTIINNLKKELYGTIEIEYYYEKEKKWDKIKIGALETEELYKNFVKGTGPGISLEGLPEGSKLTLSWIPITREHMFLDNPEKFIQHIADVGKYRIKLSQIEEEHYYYYYSNEFTIKCKKCD